MIGVASLDTLRTEWLRSGCRCGTGVVVVELV